MIRAEILERIAVAAKRLADGISESYETEAGGFWNVDEDALNVLRLTLAALENPDAAVALCGVDFKGGPWDSSSANMADPPPFEFVPQELVDDEIRNQMPIPPVEFITPPITPSRADLPIKYHYTWFEPGTVRAAVGVYRR